MEGQKWLHKNVAEMVGIFAGITRILVDSHAREREKRKLGGKVWRATTAQNGRNNPNSIWTTGTTKGTTANAHTFAQQKRRVYVEVKRVKDVSDAKCSRPDPDKWCMN